MAAWGKKALIIAAIVIVVMVGRGRLLVVPPAHQHPFDGHVDVRGRVHPAAAVPGVLDAARTAYKEGTGEGTSANPRQGEGVQVRERTCRWLVARAGRARARSTSLSHLPRQRREVRERCCKTTEDDVRAKTSRRSNYNGDPGYRPRFGACCSATATMGSIPEYVSQFEISPLYSQINYQGSPGAREPAGLCRPVQVVHEPRGRASPPTRWSNMTTQDAEIVRLERQPDPLLSSRSRSRATSTATCSSSTPSTCSTRSRFRDRRRRACRGGSARCSRAPSACSAERPSSASSWCDATHGRDAGPGHRGRAAVG